MAGFWKREVPWADKKGHLGPSAYRKAVGQLNSMPYRKLSQNKLSETAILRLFHIPTPEYLGYYNGIAGQDADGMELCSLDHFRSFLGKFTNYTKICFKPLEGWAGHGFEIAEVRIKDNDICLLRLKNQTVMTVGDFKSEVIDKLHGGSSIIEACIEQHPVLASFNSSSVNTMRLWIVRMPDKKAEVVLGYLRIGREGSLVDNQSSGGIVAPIDLITGNLRAAIDGHYHHNTYSRHPDNNRLIAGITIPYFEESIALAKRVLLAFPRTRFAGADIAVSSDGPQVIEINISPDREGAAFVGVPSKSVFASALNN